MGGLMDINIQQVQITLKTLFPKKLQDTPDNLVYPAFFSGKGTSLIYTPIKLTT